MVITTDAELERTWTDMRTIDGWRAAGILGVVLAACSGTTASVSLGQAAGDVATAVCNKLNSCAALVVNADYGDVATCITRETLAYKNTLSAPSTGWSPASLDACAQAVPGASCVDLLGHNLPAACQTPAGHLAAGAACADNAQCQSAYCNIASGSCGACSAAPTAGGACTGDAQCPQGEICSSVGACVTPAAAGSTCSSTQPCQATLVCKNGACTESDAAGASCTLITGTFGSCNDLANLFCNGSVCTSLTFAAAGQACGAMLTGLAVTGFAVCSASGQCVDSVCHAFAADGAACSATGAKCMPPASCQNGVCTMPDSTSCQ